MLYRGETTDPITRRDIGDVHDHTFVVEKGTYEQLTVYFVSEETKKDLSDITGVVSSCVHERTRHLLFADYDSRAVQSRILLAHL